MKKFVVLIICLFAFNTSVFAGSAKASILMEYTTKEVLMDDKPLEHLAPASMTKIMTLLLIMESIDNGKIKLTDKVTVSENASNMGGSQVYLNVGEEMTVEDLIKSICIASANDLAVTKKKSWSIGEKAIIKQLIEIII